MLIMLIRAHYCSLLPSGTNAFITYRLSLIFLNGTDVKYELYFNLQKNVFLDELNKNFS